MKDMLRAIRDRRTFYNIEKVSPVGDEELIEKLEEVVKYSPSAFNMQSGKIIILLEDQHDKLWDIVMETLRKRVPAEKFGRTEAKVNGFKAGYGTILYFDDKSIVKEFAEQNPHYADNFELWAQHGAGIIQGNIWNELEDLGFGANLQHYNPIIDDEVKKTWSVPDSWQLLAQMPFGLPTSEPDEKEFDPIDERVKVFK